MTKEAALYNFWSGFGLPAYEENSVFAMAEQGNAPAYPYITYEVRTGSNGVAMPLSATAWYRSTSWNSANAKKAEIATAIEYGGISIGCDGGYIRLIRSEDFADNLGDPADDMIKKVVMRYTAEFNTEN